jgi:hypothetical protein
MMRSRAAILLLTSLFSSFGIAADESATVAPNVNAPISDVGRFAVDLPNGGLIWATEDPAMVAPILNVNSPTLVSFSDNRITEPVHFNVYSNYTAFIKRMEIVVYSANDTDLLTPLATVKVKPENTVDIIWDGKLSAAEKQREGDELQYVLRAWSKEGLLDETYPRTFQLVRPEDRERSLQQIRDSADAGYRSMSAQELESKLLTKETYGSNGLRLQNIPIYGSRVRLVGQDIPDDYSLTVNNVNIPVDLNRTFAAEYLLPIGKHEFDLQLSNAEKDKKIDHELDVDVTGRYIFLTAIADATISESNMSGSVEPLDGSEQYDDSLVDGRLGFYLKGKIKGKYLITAQADTQENQVDDLFTGFLTPDSQDIFRRLDPNAYYPVYGDDSTTTRDIDTQGKLYLRVDWDKNQAVWGNYQTGFTGTEYSQYVRSLYGGALNWRSEETTELGDPSTEMRVFGSEAQTALGHTQFLGTGGSLYYLKQTDLLPGSDQVTLEVRDRTTGQVQARVVLARGADYDINYLQGRIILNRPLMQIANESVPSIIKDKPLDGYDNILLADYEYNLTDFTDNATVGLRGKKWLGDHFAVGTTYVDENRDGDDYLLMGADVTLQAGRGTYVKVETAHTESAVAPLFYSNNGGLSFTQLNPLGAREGDANSVEARVNLKEQHITEKEWTLGTWASNVDSGYSISRLDFGSTLKAHGVEMKGEVTDNLQLTTLLSEADYVQDGFDNSLDQGLARLDWEFTEIDTLSGEVRQVTQVENNVNSTGELAAVQYKHRFGSSLDVYGIVQQTVDNDGGAYPDNNAYTLGSRYQFGNLSTVGAEYTTGDRGDAVTIDSEYRLTQDHTLYAGYTFVDSTETTDPSFLGNDGTLGDNPGGLTLGQRWRVSDQVSMFNESQSLKSGADTGIAHTFGMDFYPGDNYNLGFTLQEGTLNSSTGDVDRQAVSIRGGRTTAETTWSSAIENRRDSGAQHDEQWVTTNRVVHKLDEAWRVAGYVNYADTTDYDNSDQLAKFAEVNLGFAWRPVDGTPWNMLGKYTYLYDLSPLGQDDSFAKYDQRSQVLSWEAIYRFNQRAEMAAKLASRFGEARTNRDSGEWYDSRANLEAIQGRYKVYEEWSALAEYRVLEVQHDGVRQGWLVGVDRDIGPNFRLGAGYNFTDFSDDLTNQGYTYEGWFLNMVGYY